MISDEAMNAALEASPGERVTEKYMRSRISMVKFHKLGPTLTHCVIHLMSGADPQFEASR